VKKFLRASLAALLILGATAPVAKAENTPRKILTGWIPYYSMKTSLPDALNNADIIKEVMPFWYTLKYDGKNKLSVVTDLYAPANPSVPIDQPLTALKNAGFTIIPTITDGMAKLVLAGLLKSPTSRAQIINAIMELIRKHNYDGIDLDFEGFAFVDGNTTWKSTAPNWVALVRELSAVLKAENKLLSVSTPYVWDPNEKQKGYFVYAWADIAPYIDRLRIMTYDYSVSKVGPIGPLAWTERTVKYAVSIMPASKVYIGVPGYGRDWVTAVNGICPANLANSVKAGAKAATFVMRNALSLAAMKATLSEILTEANFAKMIELGNRWCDGVDAAIKEFDLDWHCNRLGARGEYIFDARSVAALGNGSTDAGAERLDKMREDILRDDRKAKIGEDSKAYRHLLA
jgi:hypothetical protein